MASGNSLDFGWNTVFKGLMRTPQPEGWGYTDEARLRGLKKKPAPFRMAVFAQIMIAIAEIKPMERGLMWLPLLALFIGLAWAGWNEYQKVEAYRTWAQGFDRTKYDIYAVLGEKGDCLTWGKPTRKGPVNQETFSLKEVQSLNLLVNQQPVTVDTLPENLKAKTIALEFLFPSPQDSVQIPFTEVAIAVEWTKYLQQQWQKWQEGTED